MHHNSLSPYPQSSLRESNCTLWLHSRSSTDSGHLHKGDYSPKSSSFHYLVSTYRLLYSQPQTIGVFSRYMNANLIKSIQLTWSTTPGFSWFSLYRYIYSSQFDPNAIYRLGFWKLFISNLFNISPVYIAQFITCSWLRLLFSFRTASFTIY